MFQCGIISKIKSWSKPLHTLIWNIKRKSTNPMDYLKALTWLSLVETHEWISQWKLKRIFTFTYLFLLDLQWCIIMPVSLKWIMLYICLLIPEYTGKGFMIWKLKEEWHHRGSVHMVYKYSIKFLDITFSIEICIYTFLKEHTYRMVWEWLL